MRASFFTFVDASASTCAASRAARALPSTSVLTSMLRSSENDEIVAVNHFVEALVPQPLLDLTRLGAEDGAQLVGVEVHEAPGELPPVAVGDEIDHRPRREFTVDPHHAGGQEAAPIPS